MSKWTPGPWRDDSAGKDAMVSTGCAYDRAISIDCTRSGATVAEDKANAAIISAAPELVEAADFALNAIIGCAVTAGGVDDRATLLEAQDKLRAALRKAGAV